MAAIFDISLLTGIEMILFEKKTGIKFGVATAELEDNDPSAAVTLGIAWLWRRREEPELEWEDFLSEPVDVSLGFFVDQIEAQEEDDPKE